MSTHTQHVYQLVPRPAWAKVSRVLDRTETEQFKRFFDDWAVMIRVRPGGLRQRAWRRGIHADGRLEAGRRVGLHPADGLWTARRRSCTCVPVGWRASGGPGSRAPARVVVVGSERAAAEAMAATAVKMDADVRAIYKPAPAVIPNAVSLKFIRQSNEQLEGINVRKRAGTEQGGPRADAVTGGPRAGTVAGQGPGRAP